MIIFARSFLIFVHSKSLKMKSLQKIAFLLAFVGPLSITAQIEQKKAAAATNKVGSAYQFMPVISLATTPVKNQAKSNTCWSYATNSFLESELLRLGKSETDLSELFIVRNIYLEKAEKFVRMLGKTQFAAGGQSHDATHAIQRFGLVPQNAFVGKQPTFDHFAWDDSLRAYLDEVVRMPKGKLDPNWKANFIKKMDDFTGPMPDHFDVDGKTMTPVEYAASLGFKTEDYIEIGSYTHHPYYSSFVLECPDNWAFQSIYNVPIEDMEAITDSAIAKGFSLVWDGDVSEKSFSHKNGLAVVPKKLSALDFDKINDEATISPEFRQAAFDDLSTQDDHLMHITGIAKDQTGKEFYKIKNSWGTDRNECKGYLYMSKPYFQYKTIMVTVHKNAIPKAIAEKLRLK
jgi:bleomycin hydrolase